MTRAPHIWRPALGPLRGVVYAIERLADLLFSSRWNPIYKSGTIAVAALALLVLSGTYLLCFYDIAAPYESVSRIQTNIWFGQLLRTAHRISSDMFLIFALLHLTQILVRGKTFGPRRIAWWSGFFLLALVLISAWTGFVLVWDVFGQRIALLGAAILRVLPLLQDTLAQAFDGSTPLLESFFFMNLFLHVALPVGIIGGLWVHTSRLARPMWFPRRAVLIGTTLCVLAVSLIAPAPLAAKANLFSLLGNIPSDWWYSVWFLPLEIVSAPIYLVVLILLIVVALSIPFWLHPKKMDRRQPSVVEEVRCSGCTQCVRDCPYQAIRMVPRTDGRRLLAEVDPTFCVSCGVCVASCDDEAIGPLDRRAASERERFDEFISQRRVGTTADVGLIVCSRNRDILHRLKNLSLPEPFPIDCVGALHHTLILRALDVYRGLVVVGCPRDGCENRVGTTVCEERLLRTRVPFLPKGVDQHRIVFCSLSDIEGSSVAFRHRKLVEKLTGERARDSWRRAISQRIRAPLATITAGAMLTGVAWTSHAPLGSAVTEGMMRVSVRLRGLGETVCRELTDAEKANRPRHMQAPLCNTERPPYRLRIELDGTERVNRVFTHLGVRGDAPLFVHEDLSLSPRTYQVNVHITPEGPSVAGAEELAYLGEVQISAGTIHLITRDVESPTSLRVVSQAPRITASP